VRHSLALGGGAIYTVGHPAPTIAETLPDPVTDIAVALAVPAITDTVFSKPSPLMGGRSFEYGKLADHIYDPAGVIIADAIALTGGGNIRLDARQDIFGRRDVYFDRIFGVKQQDYEWNGLLSQRWRPGDVTAPTSRPSVINPQLFRDGIGTLGGGDITVRAGGTISALQMVAGASLIAPPPVATDAAPTRLLVTLGGGSVTARAGADILGSSVYMASGAVRMSAGGRLGGFDRPDGTTLTRFSDLDGELHFGVEIPASQREETRISIDDATVDLAAGGALTIGSVGQLDDFYTDRSAVHLVANGAINITNVSVGGAAMYPGTLTLASLTGDVDVHAIASPVGLDVYDPIRKNPPERYHLDAVNAIVLAPSPLGQLSILAAGDISATTIGMLDTDPAMQPGLFASISSFPVVVPTTSQADRERQHAQIPTHADDDLPVYLYAGGDIGGAGRGMTLSVPKQARIVAGRDIVNMMFFGQNLSDGDLTRIVAGRDIIGTQRALNQKVLLQGNSFILGGPGDLVVEAGRDLGPFLNSAVAVDFIGKTRGEFGGGIITVGNIWNPYLAPVGANLGLPHQGGPLDKVELRRTWSPWWADRSGA
jgi:hypothetical protein